MILLQNRSPEASRHLFLSFLEKSFENLFEKSLDDPTSSSSLNTSPRSEINFTTETKRCRQKRFPILLALIDLTGLLCISSPQWLVTSATIHNRGIYIFHRLLVAIITRNYYTKLCRIHWSPYYGSSVLQASCLQQFYYCTENKLSEKSATPKQPGQIQNGLQPIKTHY